MKELTDKELYQVLLENRTAGQPPSQIDVWLQELIDEEDPMTDDEVDDEVGAARAEDILNAIRKRRREREDMLVLAILNGPAAEFDLLTEDQYMLLVNDWELRQIVNRNITLSLKLDADNPDKNVIRECVALDEQAHYRIMELLQIVPDTLEDLRKMVHAKGYGDDE